MRIQHHFTCDFHLSLLPSDEIGVTAAAAAAENKYVDVDGDGGGDDIVYHTRCSLLHTTPNSEAQPSQNAFHQPPAPPPLPSLPLLENYPKAMMIWYAMLLLKHNEIFLLYLYEMFWRI